MSNTSGLPTPPLTAAGPSLGYQQQQPSAHGNSSMDTLIGDITSSSNPHTLNALLKNFGSKDIRETIFGSLLLGGQDPLQVLDVRRNTLGYLYLLSARLSHASSDTPSLRVIADFCRGFDPDQARIAHERVTMLGRGIARIAEMHNAPKIALLPLRDLVVRYAPSPSYLTTLHPIFLRTCVATWHFALALPVLAHPITEISTALTDIHYNDHLIYHYAGGVAFAALKRWAEAEGFFEIVVSSPANAPAAIQLDALKRLSLVQLILYGKTKTLPKYTNIALPRLLKTSPYAAIIKAYPSSMGDFNKVLEREEKLFTTDKNVGLLKQVVERAPRWRVKKLTETYVTLSLIEIGKQSGVPNVDAVRALVLSMIEDDDIHAAISADGAVTFEEPETAFSKSDVEDVLCAAQEQAFAFAELDREVGRSRDFLNKALKTKDEGAYGGGEELLTADKMGGWADETLF